MKTLLYNPIFINPQAYYVFPRLTRYLQPDNESTSEPANYIGTIEVKVIAYGDTTLKRTYTNTDSIDLSEFKNTWINVSLFTKVGSCVLGEWKIGNMESDLPYIDPEVLASLKAVVIVGNKTNNDSDRAIVKNLVDPDNPFVIGNAAFKLNSGFGKYETELSDTRIWTRSKDVTSSPFSSSYNGLSGWIIFANTELTNSVDIPSIKIEVKGLLEGQELIYRYYDSTGQTNVYSMTKDGEYTLPADVRTAKPLTSNTSGFQIVKNETNTITITQIPSFEGAFVTDGIDDLITSTKTVQEMLGESNEITVVSMIHQVKDSTNNVSFTNYIRGSANGYFRNIVNNYDKTGIYGYTSSDLIGLSVVNNILGDKNDYTSNGDNRDSIINGNFSVQGYSYNDGNNTGDFSSVAWYWTIIANKVLTTDQINQVIAYFNLDRTLRPDILCNITKQGITNDNHADFNDKLIDYSGNGRDIQMNNLAWKGGSGIAAKPFETIKDYTIVSDEARQKLTIYNEFSYKVKSNTPNHYWTVQSIIKDNTSYQVTIITDKDCYWINSTSFINNEGNKESIRKEYPVKANTPTQVTICGLNEFEYPEDIEPTTAVSYVNLNYAGEVTVTFIPSYKGGLLLDGVNDFGKVTGMPIYKDYTVVADRELFNAIGCVLSNDNPGAFIFEISSASVYSFGEATTSLTIPTDKQIRYQTKYSYNGQNISIGAVKEGTSNMWLGTIRDNDARFISAAIYSLMTFPYSMSEFLIERQLKKHKLGTLYPDMVEFRPIVTYDKDLISKLKYFYIPKYANWVSISPGDYLPNNAEISFTVDLRYPVDEVSSNLVFSNLENVRVVKSSGSGNSFDIRAYVTNKSPQKINITIDEYIRYEDIVQPYPVLLRFNDENGNEVSWGGKFRVGSTITRIGNIADPESNLLNGLYSISGLSLNGKAVTSSTSIVEKQMVFKTIATYLLDNNEPKCILSPRLLSIPNSSYKILGYIPDISGHGNNGVIHNSAYAEGSGVNEDGSYQFDGVDDFVTIPTLSRGGKQVLMKVNWNTINSIIYDQRGSGGFAIYCSDYNNPSDSITVPAYKGRNAAGTTYIDGIRNEYIIASQLRNVTHNIVEILDTSYAAGNINPIIGKSYMNSNYGSLALYDFMLFDNISTDDKIKQLNEYVGIEAKVELPPYYWDAYGKTNLDGDKATIQQRGVAVGDYDLTNYNHTYEGMSGYNGYPVVFGANKTWANESNGYVTSITSNTIHITNVLNAGLALLYSYVKYNGNLQNIKEIPPFKIEIKGLEGRSKFIYKYLATSDATKETNLYLENGTHELPKSFLPTEALINNAVVGFSISPIEEGVTNFLSDITIKVLPEYENGLVYDGVEDYSVNTNIPALTDYTYVIKRENLNNNVNSATMYKGNKDGGGAFIVDYIASNGSQQYSYGNSTLLPLNENTIIYGTKTSYNGSALTVGSNTDENGLDIGHWSSNYKSIVLYKLVLYPKTIPLLQINFLKNLMEKDEIIDLTNPIFIQE